jgi:hypothetical protein
MISATTISPVIIPIRVTAMLALLSVDDGVSPVSTRFAPETYYGKILVIQACMEDGVH